MNLLFFLYHKISIHCFLILVFVYNIFLKIVHFHKKINKQINYYQMNYLKYQFQYHKNPKLNLHQIFQYIYNQVFHFENILLSLDLLFYFYFYIRLLFLHFQFLFQNDFLLVKIKINYVYKEFYKKFQFLIFFHHIMK